MKTAVFTLALAAVASAADPEPAKPAGDAEQTAAFDKKEAVVVALQTCFMAQKTASATLDAAKTACKIDAGVKTALTAWGKKGTSAELVDRLLRNEPMLQTAIETDFAVDVKDATDAAIEAIIGVDAGATDKEKAAGIKDYRQKEGADKWADAVKTCKATAVGDVAKKACVTGSVVDLCIKTNKALGCCTAAAGASNCDAKDAFQVIEKAADDKMSQATTACSNVAGARSQTAVDACMTLAAAEYTAITGVDMTGDAGLTKRKEKLEKAAKGAVGDAVGACMADLDTDATASDRMSCVGGPEAKKAMADALGKAAGDITKTDAAKFAQEGARTAGSDKMKTFTGTGTDAEKLAQKLGAARTDMAAAAGKKSGTACDDKDTYTPDCMTAVDAKKAIAVGAQDCMADAIAACITDTPGADCGLTGSNKAAIKTAVFECNGLDATSMSDDKFAYMQEKAKAGKVTDAYKAATSSCAGAGATKATCVKTAAMDACKSAKGAVCEAEELILGRNKGAAKDMADTIAACMDSGESTCATAKQAAYTASTGKTYTATGAAKLQKDGARGAVADLMGACYDLAAGTEVQINAAKAKCNDPAEKPEIKQAYAAALGFKSADDISNTEYKEAVVKGAKGDTGVAVGVCLDKIASTGTTRKTAVKACHSDSIALARDALGDADMSEGRVKEFLQESAKGLEKDKFEACFETAGEATGADADATTAAILLAKNDCRGKGTGAAVVAKRDAFKETCGKPNWTDTRAEKEMYDNTLVAVADDFENCMDTNAPKTGVSGALEFATGAQMKTAFATCKTAANTKRADLTGEVADPIKAQKDCVRAAKKKVAETVGACKAAGGVGVATCGDPANNPDLLNKLKLTTGKIDMSHTEARALVKESGNKAAGDFMKTCMEDSNTATFAGCLVDGRKAMGDATGNTFTDDAAGIREANKEFMGGLREAAKDEVADAFGACVKSKATVDAPFAGRTHTDCKTAKVEAFKATGLGDGKTDKQIKRIVAKVMKKGAQKSMANAKQACIDLAAGDAAATVLCNTNEIRDAKIAKAEAEGKDVADIKDADVAKDLELGKEADTSEAMEACTEKATGTAAEIKTKTRACVTDVETLVAATEGKTKGAMDLNKIKQRMEKAGVASFAKSMNACMDAAGLETGAAVDTAKDACKTAETDMFTKATGKIAGDIKEGDVAKAREDAAVKAFMETNIATANAVVDGETYTDNQKQAAVKEALKKVEGDKSTTEFEKTKLVSLKKKAGAKAIGDKAVACVMATASDAAALAACDDANLMDEAKLATGETIVTDVDVKKKDKRKAAKDLLKAKLNACGKFTVDADDLKVATFLKRGEKMFNDKKQAIAEIISDKMKEATGGVRDATTGVVTPPANTVTEAEKTLAKRDKMKVELKLLADAKDGSVAEVTDEELDATLDVGAADLLDSYDDCATADKAACKSEIEADLKKALGCETKAIQVKKNQIAKLVAAQYGADIKAADDAKTPAEKTAAPVRDEAAVEALMKTKFESVGGVKGTFDACKAEIKKAKDAYVLNKDVVIKKKESVDIVIAYDATAGACEVADDVLIKAKLEAADTTMDIVEVTASTLDGTKCRTTYVAKKKAGEKAATMLELKGSIAAKYTAVTTTGRRLNGRRLPTGMDSSADQSTEIDSQEQPKPAADPVDPADPKSDPAPTPAPTSGGAGDSSSATTAMVSSSMMAVAAMAALALSVAL